MKFTSKKKIASQPSRFADFFLNASSGEQKKVIKQAVKQANKEQRELLDKYEKEFSTK